MTALKYTTGCIGQVFATVVILCFLWSPAFCRAGAPRERILFDFESEEELDHFQWKCHTLFSLSDEYVTHGKKSLRLELYPSDYPGLEPLLAANDWRRYRAFSFDIFNRQAVRVPITVRIDDRQDYPDYEDRFNRNFILEPGPNLVRIPLAGLATSGGKRILNLKSIFRVFIFMAHPEKRIVLYVDSIRLVSE